MTEQEQDLLDLLYDERRERMSNLEVSRKKIIGPYGIKKHVIQKLLDKGLITRFRYAGGVSYGLTIDGIRKVESLREEEDELGS